MSTYFLRLFYFVLMCSFLINCNKEVESTAKLKSASIDSIAAHYYEDYLKLHPLEATAQGDNRYNDLLPINISRAQISKEISLYNEYQQDLQTIDYENLSEDKKVIYDVLDYELKDKIEKFAYKPELIPFNQFEGLPLEFPLLGSGEGNQPFNNQSDYDNWLKRMDLFAVWMDSAQVNFRHGAKTGYVLPKKLVEKMIPQMKAEEITTLDMHKNIFYGPIEHLPANFTALEKNKYSKLYQEVIKSKIIPAYVKMGKFLETEYLPKARLTDGYNALSKGNAIYAYYAKSWTTTQKTPDEINKLGLEQVEMLRSEMKKVQQQVGFDGTLEAFLNFEKNDPKAMPYKSSKEIITAFNDILSEIQPGLEKMFNVTPKTPFEIRQTEKFREASASAEYMQGTPDGKRPGIFYIPLPDPSKFNVTSGMESLFLHEAIPGHHYQISLQQENLSLPKFMRFGWLGAYGEGWAHYCETLGPELGLYKDPYQKLGYLSDQMLRAVRLVVDTGIHSGKMTREEAITYFLNNVAYDEAGATAEVERYMALPGQALSYKIGALKIRELRTSYEKSLGKKFNLANFHDAVLSQGCLPLDVLDRKMKNWASKQ